MRIALFCENRYAIDIVEPLARCAARRGEDVMWFIDTRKIKDYKPGESVNWTDSIRRLYNWKPEAIFVPGNIVPYYLPGVKIQIFHGYAAEKKDHWIIRRYFDLYLTQGPYFTSHFEASARRYGDFEVKETGWTKQDWIANHLHAYDDERESLLEKYGKKRIVLYAPTFSPKLTSLPHIKGALEEMLARNPDMLLLLKFHPLTAQNWIDEYREWADKRNDTIFIDRGQNITKVQLMSDLVISDTSSAVYEFLLLGRPVVTLNTIAKDIYWENITDASELAESVDRAFNNPESIERSRWIQENYDPHLDGHCCDRMIEAAQDYIDRHGVPQKRKLNLWRRYTSVKKFGPAPKS